MAKYLVVDRETRTIKRMTSDIKSRLATDESLVEVGKDAFLPGTKSEPCWRLEIDNKTMTKLLGLEIINLADRLRDYFSY